MKRAMLLAAATLLFCLPEMSAQTQPDTTQPKKPDTINLKVPDTMINPTVSDITTKYQRKEMPAPMTVEKVFPVLGTYVSDAQAEPVQIRLDETSRSWIVVTGLPQGTVKAMLMRSPAVYKIPKQKTDTGTEIPEGTLIYTPDVNALHICIGKPFEFSNPGSVFQPASPEKTTTPEKPIKERTDKKDKKPEAWTYTGMKQEAMTTAKQ